ncbi:MAG: GNAT family N-acetyltransferase [Acidovorax sp.]
MLVIRPARFPEYVRSPTVNLGFQDYEKEFAALRRIDARTCELKRVYVRPAARGHQAGRQLVESMLREARAADYRRMCLDVLPEFVAAQRLYASLGFVDAEPVSHNPVPGTRFLALEWG